MKRLSLFSAITAITFVLAIASFNSVAAQTVEDQYWDLVKNSSDISGIQSYLREYPNGKYAPLARRRLNPQQPQGPQRPPTVFPPSNQGTSVLQTSVNRTRQTEAQFLDSWFAEVKSKLPRTVDGIRFYGSFPRCPTCKSKSDSKYMSVWAQTSDSNSSQMRMRADKARPAFLKDYCASGAPERRINFNARFFLKRNSNQDYQYWIFPEDCQPGTIRETDTALLNRWALLTRKDFPLTFGDFQFKTAASRCRTGCETTLANKPALTIDVVTPRHTAQMVTKAQVEQSLKQVLLKNYCTQEPSNRGFQIFVSTRDMNNRFISRFVIRPTDCAR